MVGLGSRRFSWFRKRRLLRFSLRTLLVAFTVLSIWMGLYVRSVQRQRVAVKAIEEYGGWVRYDFQFPSGNYHYSDFDAQAGPGVPKWLLDYLGLDYFYSVVQVNLNYSEDSGQREENSNRSDDALEHLPNLPDLRVLLLSGTQARDESLRHLVGLEKLEHLYMWDVGEVSDRGVEHLKDLTNMKYIHISESQISDGSLRVFGNFHQLEGLSLQGNHFTDEGLRALSKLRRLESLWVNHGTSEFTDEGLATLLGLENLETLAVRGREITDEGIYQLRSLANLSWLMVTSPAVSEEGRQRLLAELAAPSAKCDVSH